MLTNLVAFLWPILVQSELPDPPALPFGNSPFFTREPRSAAELVKHFVAVIRNFTPGNFPPDNFTSDNFPPVTIVRSKQFQSRIFHPQQLYPRYKLAPNNFTPVTIVRSQQLEVFGAKLNRR